MIQDLNQSEVSFQCQPYFTVFANLTVVFLTLIDLSNEHFIWIFTYKDQRTFEMSFLLTDSTHADLG